MFICTPEQMKMAEEQAVRDGQSFLGLMENAGAALAAEIIRRVPKKSRGLILCGRGNNGGDGFTAARLLSEKGMTVTVALLCGEPTGGIARTEFDRMGEKVTVTGIDGICFSEGYDFICDAVFGTGFHGELADDIALLFERLDRLPCVKIAADIPSGADSLSGRISRGTMHMDATVTFGAVKCGMLLPPAKYYCGGIITADIGISDECFGRCGRLPVLIDDDTAAKALPVRNEFSHKGCFGRLLIIAGSENMSGAAALNLSGALRSGAGLVRLASVKTVIDRAAAGIYESTFLTLPQNSFGGISADAINILTDNLPGTTVCAVGSGLTSGEDSRIIVKEMIGLCGENNIPLIIDADGLNCLCGCIDILRNANCRAVLTPHIGELSRLLGISVSDVTADRLGAAARLAEMSGAVVAAKGMPTYIVSPDGRTAASYTGNGGLSRGGSGDVLTGVISGICTSNMGERLFESVCAGVYTFGLAADIAADNMSMTGMLPSDAAAQLPFAFKILERR